MVRTIEHVSRTYKAADGTIFNTHEAAVAYEQALPAEAWFKINLPSFDLSETVSRLWRIDHYSTRTVHVPEQDAGFLRPYQEAYDTTEDYVSYSEIGYGNAGEVMRYCCKKYPRDVRNNNLKLFNPDVRNFAEEIGERTIGSK